MRGVLAGDAGHRTSSGASTVKGGSSRRATAPSPTTRCTPSGSTGPRTTDCPTRLSRQRCVTQFGRPEPTGDRTPQFLHHPIEPQPGHGPDDDRPLHRSPTSHRGPGASALGPRARGNDRGADPHAHPSDSKGWAVVDYETGLVTVRVNPSCSGSRGTDCQNPLPTATDFGDVGVPVPAHPDSSSTRNRVGHRRSARTTPKVRVRHHQLRTSGMWRRASTPRSRCAANADGTASVEWERNDFPDARGLPPCTPTAGSCQLAARRGYRRPGRRACSGSTGAHGSSAWLTTATPVPLPPPPPGSRPLAAWPPPPPPRRRDGVGIVGCSSSGSPLGCSSASSSRDARSGSRSSACRWCCSSLPPFTRLRRMRRRGRRAPRSPARRRVGRRPLVDRNDGRL